MTGFSAPTGALDVAPAGGGQRHALVWGVAPRQTGTGQTWTGGAERPSSMATAVTGRPAARIETPLSVLFTRGIG
jgi:hypothetical protein